MKHKSKSQAAAPQLPFAKPEHPAQVYLAKVDGASRGNPGPAAYAVVLRAPDGAAVFEIGKYIGRTTNNVAEYYALIAALDYAASHSITRLRVESDSELLVRQMHGRYKVKSADLRPLHERAQKLARGLAHFAIEHIPRERNAEADALANAALDGTSSHGTLSREVYSREMHPRTQPAAKREAKPAAEPSRREQRVRARYSAGALHPLEALDLAEGDVVELRITKKSPA